MFVPPLLPPSHHKLRTVHHIKILPSKWGKRHLDSHGSLLNLIDFLSKRKFSSVILEPFLTFFFQRSGWFCFVLESRGVPVSIWKPQVPTTTIVHAETMNLPTFFQRSSWNYSSNNYFNMVTVHANSWQQRNTLILPCIAGEMILVKLY